MELTVGCLEIQCRKRVVNEKSSSGDVQSRMRICCFHPDSLDWAASSLLWCRLEGCLLHVERESAKEISP
jgi:hypothetical protein